MKKQTRILAFILACVLLLSLTACGSSAPNPTVANTQATTPKDTDASESNVHDMKGEITFSFWGLPEEVAVQEQITAEFNKVYPNIKVNLDHVSGNGDYNQTILTRIAGNNAPDVFYMGEVMVPIYSEKGVLEDLMPYATRDEIDFDDYWSGVLTPCGYNDGNLWAFAKDCGPYFIYYNKAHFDEIGEPYPDGSWDTAKFEEVCKKLTKTDDKGKITRYGLAAENGWCSWFALAYKNGGKIMDDECHRFVDDPKTAEILQWYFDLSNVEHVTTNPDIMVSMGGGAEVDVFKGDLASMVIGGRFMTYFLKDFTGDYGFTTFPKAEDENQPLQFVSLGMSKDSKNKDAAWEFIKFYCGKTGQEINSATGMGLPVMKSVTESGVWMLPGETEQNKNVVMTQFNNTKDLPYHPEWGKVIDDIWTRNMKEAARGKTTAQEALTVAVAECNAYLDENGL